MLDRGVDALLPDSFPFLAPSSWEETFIIDKAVGKGLGMFAERAIHPNEVILVEHPVAVIPLVLGLGVPLSEICDDLFRRLSKSVRQELVDLLFSVSGDAVD